MYAKAYQTILKMFKARKYTSIVQGKKEISYFNGPIKGICILTIHAINIKPILSNLINDYKQITIVCHVINATLKKIALSSERMIEFFQYDELQYNILDHYLQPEFVLLTDEETIIWKKLYLKKLKNFPRMLETDPVARYFKLKPLDVIKVVRDGLVTYTLVK